MPLTDSEGIQSGAVWGLYLIGIAFLFSFQRAINAIFADSFAIKFISIEGFLFLLVLTAIIHTRGFIYMGSKYDSSILKFSALALTVVFGLFGFFLLTSIFVAAFEIGTVQTWDALIGLSITLLLVTEAFFLYGLAKLYKKLGILAVASALLPFWVVLMWYGWPIILVALPSTLFLFRESNS